VKEIDFFNYAEGSLNTAEPLNGNFITDQSSKTKAYDGFQRDDEGL
jgi:hypothetical protein